MKRIGLLFIASCAALVASGVAAGAAPSAPTISDLGAWATAGSRLAVSGTVNHRDGLWVQTIGSTQPRLLTTRCGEGNAPSQIAAGPNGSWACLTAVVGNTEAFYAVDLVLGNGSVRHVATAGGSIDSSGTAAQKFDSIPQIIGDGSFLGYLRVTPAGVTQLFQIGSTGHARRVASLPGVSAVATASTQDSNPEVSAANGTVAILQVNGTVAVFTVAGAPLAAIPAHGAAVAVTGNRVVVRTRTRRLVVYGLHGGLVHNWRLGATNSSNGLAAFDGYAAYIGADKAVRVVKLSNGTDRVVARSGAGWFWNGVSLQAPGIVAPLTTQHGKSFVSTPQFVPTAKLR
ncbi:MAG TPA: hypothetical protein VHS03_16535 [Gaiellaceae bacterium]|nr:hypothetical protein [Gaiellaceae bacterium]